MNGEDQFESRLKRQPLKPTPAEWRQEILEAAFQARCSSRGQPSKVLLTTEGNEVLTSRARAGRSGLSLVAAAATRVFSQLLWPSGKAWAALAAIWVAIIGFIVISADSDQKHVASRFERPSPLMQKLLREQNQLFVELSGRTDQGEAITTRRDQRGPRSRCDVAWREV